MKKANLQFLKKINLARRLAAAGLPELLRGIPGFTLPRLLAFGAVQKNNLSPAENLRLFLDSAEDSPLRALAEELDARPDIINRTKADNRAGEPYSVAGSFCAARAALWEQADSARCVFEGLCRIYPPLSDHRQIFFKRLDSLTDMRFYGSDLETLIAETTSFESACPLEVDWSRTDSSFLWLQTPPQGVFGARLSRRAQSNLWHLALDLLRGRQLFVSSFHGVLSDRFDRVNWIYFDYLYPFDSKLLRFLQSWLQGQARPQTCLQHKLLHLLENLQNFCPDYDIKSEFAAGLSGLDFASLEPGASRAAQLADYVRRGFGNFCPPAEDSAPPLWQRLMPQRPFAEDPAFKRSSRTVIFLLLALTAALLWLF